MFDAEEMQPMITQKNGKNLIVPVMQYGIKMISIGFLAPGRKCSGMAGSYGKFGFKAVYHGCRMGRTGLLTHRSSLLAPAIFTSHLYKPYL
jgi:hypothetical protein